MVSGAKKFASKIGMNLANWHLPRHKFTGPFTELNKRIDENENPLPGYEPFNQVDVIALTRDNCYANADKNLTTVKQCDQEMLNELKETEPENIREKIDKLLTTGAIGVKHKLGLRIEKELHAPMKHKFKRRRVFVYNIDDIWSAD